MVQKTHANTVELVQLLAAESSQYARQWALWTGIGNGAAILAVLSFAANIPHPNLALHQLLPSMWLFLIGIVSSGLSLPCMASSVGAAASHYAEAHNSDQCLTTADKIPEMISYPRSIADNANRERNRLISDSKEARDEAKKAWKQRCFWRRSGNVCSMISGISFVVGVGLPLVFLTRGGILGY